RVRERAAAEALGTGCGGGAGLQPQRPRRAARRAGRGASGARRSRPGRLPRRRLTPPGRRMRVTRVATLRLGEFPSLLFVPLHTDEGLVGLGETFFFADAVEAHVHDVAAGYLLDRDPGEIERHARALRGYVGSAGSGAEMRAASAVDIALWDLCGQAAGLPLHSVLGGARPGPIRTCKHSARPRSRRGKRGQAVLNWGLPENGTEGPYEDLDAFLHRAGELARDLLAQGITGMKIWPFDPYAEASLGHDISTRDLDRALEPLRQIRSEVGS